MAEQLKIYASLAMLLLFSTWFVFSIDPEELKKQSVSNDAPDYYMNTFITTTYSDTGSVKQKLSARRLAHYPVDNRSEFSSIYISTTNLDNTVWEVTADSAIAYASTKIVNLKGDIYISEVSNTSTTKVHTENLEIDYNKEIAKTDKTVSITDKYGTITGKGMIYDFNNHTLTLTSQVRGSYNNAPFRKSRSAPKQRKIINIDGTPSGNDIDKKS